MAHPHGLFGWVDLVTSDVAAAQDFYTGLFGWQATAVPTPMGVPYTMLRLGGRLVAGLGPQPPELAAAGAPSTWNSYVIVEDVDAVVAATPGLGGQVVMAPDDVMTEGRLAMIADPSGAVVGLWQPRDMAGAEVFNEPGSLTWNELQSRNLDAATAFYSAVFGWRWESTDDGYRMCMLDAKDGDDKSNGGALSMPVQVPPEVPSLWMVYFAVADCDAGVARAQALGATVFLPAMTLGPGRFAGLTDPTGAMFMLGSFPAPPADG